MKRNIKKLSLETTTIRSLDRGSLASAAGGSYGTSAVTLSGGGGHGTIGTLLSCPVSGSLVSRLC
jgi:hypothetical protein